MPGVSVWPQRTRAPRTDQQVIRMSKAGAPAAVLSCCLLLLNSACISSRHKNGFRVLPGNPVYVLQSPDARRTPLPDLLKSFNGFQPGQPSIDLRPRMELRIENAYYRKGSSRRGLEGFLGTELARFSVLPDGLRLLSVQPMTGRPADDVPVQQLIPAPATHFRHYRLYYELLFAKSANAHGSALLGADSAAELDSLSAQLTHPETVCNAGSMHCVVFPEACSVSVELQITVNGKPQSGLWGSRLSSVVANSQSFSLRRLYKGRLTPVKLDPNDAEDLRLALLPGDEISWH